MAAICQRLSESMWPTELGLLVGLIALWSYEYLAGQLSALDQEMESASLELLNQLGRFRCRLHSFWQAHGYNLACIREEPLLFGQIGRMQIILDEQWSIA